MLQLFVRLNHLKAPTAIIVILSFAAYATGAVAAKRASASRTSAVVHLLEVLLVAGILAGIILLRQAPYSGTYLVLCILAMNLVGAVIARATLVVEGRASAGTREFEEIHGATEPIRAWQRWLSFSRAIIDLEIRWVLVACYLLIVGPFALAFRSLRAKPAGNHAASTWIPRSDTPSLDSARRPY